MSWSVVRRVKLVKPTPNVAVIRLTGKVTPNFLTLGLFEPTATLKLSFRGWILRHTNLLSVEPKVHSRYRCSLMFVFSFYLDVFLENLIKLKCAIGNETIILRVVLINKSYKLWIINFNVLQFKAKMVK